MANSQAVVASYLMSDEGASLNAALATLPEHASPNDNFLAQLSILERMGGRLDADSKVFRAFRQNRIARRAMLYGYFDGDGVGDADYGEVGAREGAGGADAGGTAGACAGAADTVFRCRTCRRVVATSSNLVEHEAAGGAGPPCHLYTEALSWMRGELEQGKLEGKLLCVGCGARIGKYSWRGMQCVCKAWVVPAFMIQRAKVDAIRSVPDAVVAAPVRGAAAAAGARRVTMASFGPGGV